MDRDITHSRRVHARTPSARTYAVCTNESHTRKVTQSHCTHARRVHARTPCVQTTMHSRTRAREHNTRPVHARTHAGTVSETASSHPLHAPPARERRTSLGARLALCLSFSLSVYLSVYLSVCLSICLFTHPASSRSRALSHCPALRATHMARRQPRTLDRFIERACG
jgi:hypothetical protein